MYIIHMQAAGLGQPGLKAGQLGIKHGQFKNETEATWFKTWPIWFKIVSIDLVWDWAEMSCKYWIIIRQDPLHTLLASFSTSYLASYFYWVHSHCLLRTFISLWWIHQIVHISCNSFLKEVISCTGGVFLIIYLRNQVIYFDPFQSRSSAVRIEIGLTGFKAV